MDEIIKRKIILSDKSKLSIELCRHDGGKLFIQLNQIIFIPELESTIVINPNNIEEIIRILSDLNDEINNRKYIAHVAFIKLEDQQKIITTFLKGIPLKHLALQFRYPEYLIREMLVANKIEIIDGIKKDKMFWKKRKK